MMPASVSKLNIHIGDPIFDRLMEEFNAAQEEGLIGIDLDVRRLDDEIRLDFMVALEDLGYEVGYSQDEEILEIWYE